MKVEIVKLDDFGRGICFVNNKVTFVPNTIPGDIVNIKIVKENKKYNEAILIDLVKSSSKRIDAPCPYFGICGGCSLQTLPYDLGISYKKDKVINYFKKMGLIINPSLITNDTPYNYRNKITLKVVNGVVGYYKLNSHSVVEVKKCILAEECINDVISIVCGMGIINGEVIIRSNYKSEILIIINSKDKINTTNISNNIKGIILNDEVIYGNDCFYEEINNTKYKVSYKAFFQVNRNVASKMFKLVEDFTNNNDCVLDLYSGVGTLGLSASKKAKNVVGVEINKDAVKDANENAVINNLNNAKFIYSDASNIKNIDVSFNKLIVDPPRAGLSTDVIDFINKKLPDEIMYISCDYHTQARDLKLLDNYEIINSYICDLFSYTYHVETVVLLSHKKPDGHINVKVEFGEGEGKVPLDNIAKRAEEYKPKERVTYKMIKEYIEAKYGFKVHTAYIAEVKRDLGLPMYDAPNAVEELKQPRKHPTAEKVEAIRDALKHFEVI